MIDPPRRAACALRVGELRCRGRVRLLCVVARIACLVVAWKFPAVVSLPLGGMRARLFLFSLCTTSAWALNDALAVRHTVVARAQADYHNVRCNDANTCPGTATVDGQTRARYGARSGLGVAGARDRVTNALTRPPAAGSHASSRCCAHQPPVVNRMHGRHGHPRGGGRRRCRSPTSPPWRPSRPNTYR